MFAVTYVYIGITLSDYNLTQGRGKYNVQTHIKSQQKVVKTAEKNGE